MYLKFIETGHFKKGNMDLALFPLVQASLQDLKKSRELPSSFKFKNNELLKKLQTRSDPKEYVHRNGQSWIRKTIKKPKHSRTIELLQRLSLDLQPGIIPIFCHPSCQAGDKAYFYGLNLLSMGYKTLQQIVWPKKEIGAKPKQTQKILDQLFLIDPVLANNIIERTNLAIANLDKLGLVHSDLQGVNIMIKIDDNNILQDVQIIDMKHLIPKDEQDEKYQVFMQSKNEYKAGDMSGQDFSGQKITENFVLAYVENTNFTASNLRKSTFSLGNLAMNSILNETLISINYFEQNIIWQNLNKVWVNKEQNIFIINQDGPLELYVEYDEVNVGYRVTNLKGTIHNN
jgi:uncharacterized protein YjbI with pentapeptide repeats